VASRFLNCLSYRSREYCYNIWLSARFFVLGKLDSTQYKISLIYKKFTIYTNISPALSQSRKRHQFCNAHLSSLLQLSLEWDLYRYWPHSSVLRCCKFYNSDRICCSRLLVPNVHSRIARTKRVSSRTKNQIIAKGTWRIAYHFGAKVRQGAHGHRSNPDEWEIRKRGHSIPVYWRFHSPR
jgi:hypothetical protein